MKKLMFADVLEAHLPGPQTPSAAPAGEPLRSFVEAANAVGQGRRDEARKV